MELVVEYLVIIPKASFCDSVEGFNKLLQVDSGLKMKPGELTYKGGFACKYQATGGDVTGKDQRFFHLRFEMDAGKSVSQSKIDKFTDFLKTVRTIISKTGGLSETLWDDISLYYSRKAYTTIHEIENLMRKLIANFMLVNVGKEWATETSPDEVREAMNKSKRKDYVNVLHMVRPGQRPDGATETKC